MAEEEVNETPDRYGAPIEEADREELGREGLFNITISPETEEPAYSACEIVKVENGYSIYHEGKVYVSRNLWDTYNLLQELFEPESKD